MTIESENIKLLLEQICALKPKYCEGIANVFAPANKNSILLDLNALGKKYDLNKEDDVIKAANDAFELNKKYLKATKPNPIDIEKDVAEGKYTEEFALYVTLRFGHRGAIEYLNGKKKLENFIQPTANDRVAEQQVEQVESQRLEEKGNNGGGDIPSVGGDGKPTQPQPVIEPLVPFSAIQSQPPAHKKPHDHNSKYSQDIFFEAGFYDKNNNNLASTFRYLDLMHHVETPGDIAQSGVFGAMIYNGTMTRAYKKREYGFHFKEGSVHGHTPPNVVKYNLSAAEEVSQSLLLSGFSVDKRDRNISYFGDVSHQGKEVKINQLSFQLYEQSPISSPSLQGGFALALNYFGGAEHNHSNLLITDPTIWTKLSPVLTFKEFNISPAIEIGSKLNGEGYYGISADISSQSRFGLFGGLELPNVLGYKTGFSINSEGYSVNFGMAFERDEKPMSPLFHAEYNMFRKWAESKSSQSAEAQLMVPFNNNFGAVLKGEYEKDSEEIHGEVDARAIWSPSKKLSFNAGFEWSRENSFGEDNSSNTTLSPRFGAILRCFGNSFLDAGIGFDRSGTEFEINFTTPFGLSKKNGNNGIKL
jgi:hypothetical protein